ncbi:MAG TPA: hypothetical protein VFV73_34365 [Streptosporangiaceae bacterium]|nr:hypothetical protein [Streptosporangiaceae bacterium]
MEAAKLLATLGVATAAAFVASALQVGRNKTDDVAAVWLIGCAFLAVIIVVLLDRSTIVDHQTLLNEVALGNFDEQQRLTDLRKDAMISVLNNDAVVRQVRFAAGLALLLAAASAAFAINSLVG